MKIEPISTIFEIYGGLYPGSLYNLEIAELNALVTDEKNIVASPHVLVIRSEQNKLDGAMLGIDSVNVMLFKSMQDAISFQDILCDLFSIKYSPCEFNP